jgi:hypothetical protein
VTGKVKMDLQGGREMVKTWILTFVVIVQFFVHAPLVFPQERVGAKMVLDEKEFNYGNANEGEIIEHAFKVVNKGNATLEIIQVEPD